MISYTEDIAELPESSKHSPRYTALIMHDVKVNISLGTSYLHFFSY